MTAGLTPTAQGAADPGAAPVRVLLVDDDPEFLHAYATVLRRAGYEVASAEDGDEALTRLEEGPLDVIVSDVAMPRLGGVELLRAVRQRDLDVPVMLVSGARNLETALKAVEFGALRYLAKPLDPAVLVDAVRDAARLHGIARAKRDALALSGGTGRGLGDRAALEVRFEGALHALWIAFQPIVSWRERRVLGFEALVRSGETTLAQPGDLIDAAERLGRLRELGRAIRAHVAGLASSAPPGALLYVNLHASDLLDDELHSPGSPLASHASRVVLEITERASLEGLRNVKVQVASLRRLGYRIAIDDLGAGYAGLSGFAALEPEVAKLDLSLVRGLDRDPRKQSIVRSMVRLSGELGVQMIAEGVETGEERDALAALGCDLMQGYLFARPARAFEAPRW